MSHKINEGLYWTTRPTSHCGDKQMFISVRASCCLYTRWMSRVHFCSITHSCASTAWASSPGSIILSKFLLVILPLSCQHATWAPLLSKTAGFLIGWFYVQSHTHELIKGLVMHLSSRVPRDLNVLALSSVTCRDCMVINNIVCALITNLCVLQKLFTTFLCVSMNSNAYMTR